MKGLLLGSLDKRLAVFFLLQQLVIKDFRVRYRNMSLGMLWAILNPLVMMSILTFVFSVVFVETRGDFPLFVLTGLLPYNFVSLAVGSATGSIPENAYVFKSMGVPRALLPLSAVLGCSLHLGIQLLLLGGVALWSGAGVSVHWLWFAILWPLFIGLVVGVSFATSALQVRFRDTRYVVEACMTVLFWCVPIVYHIEAIPAEFRFWIEVNPLTAMVVVMRDVVVMGRNPGSDVVMHLAGFATVAVIGGIVLFRRMESRFVEYL